MNTDKRPETQARCLNPASLSLIRVHPRSSVAEGLTSGEAIPCLSLTDSCCNASATTDTIVSLARAFQEGRRRRPHLSAFVGPSRNERWLPIVPAGGVTSQGRLASRRIAHAAVYQLLCDR